MIKKPHPVLAVPVIALADAVLMGLGNRAYELVTGKFSIVSWPESFRLLFWYTLIFALLAGVVLSPIFYALGKKLPEPKLLWLTVAGIMLGPVPITVLDGHLPESIALAAFCALGVVSAAIWWILVEAQRPRQIAS